MPDMRFAPPSPLRIADRASGLNAVSVRSFNERLVLSLLLQNERISRLEIGERTGLSAQTVSVIVRLLEQEGLAAKGEAQRGSVGPPTVPLLLNPDGAFAVGISFGINAVDSVLIDFVGNVRLHTACHYAELLPSPSEGLIKQARRCLAAVPSSLRGRVAGIGLAVPKDAMASANIKAILGPSLSEARVQFEEELQQPLFVQDDVTAAAGGEMLFGAARALSDFVLFYLGSNLHNRLVLNHRIYSGDAGGTYDVGLAKLRQCLSREGLGVEALTDMDGITRAGRDAYDEWRSRCCDQIVKTLDSLLNFVSTKALVLSTYAPSTVAQSLAEELSRTLPAIEVFLGRNGDAPKAVGAASLPYHSRFMVE